MATIGLDRLYYSKITEDSNGEETYAVPTVLAKAITAELSVELVEAILYADDGAAEVVKDFNSGTLTLGVAIGLLRSEANCENVGTPVAVGFRAQKANGTYRYFWLYRVKFGLPATNLQTKADSITFSTPTIEGTVMRRNKLDGMGKHPWKAEVTEGDPGVSSTTITGWFTEVYEPVYTPVP